MGNIKLFEFALALLKLFFFLFFLLLQSLFYIFLGGGEFFFSGDKLFLKLDDPELPLGQFNLSV